MEWRAYIPAIEEAPLEERESPLSASEERGGWRCATGTGEARLVVAPILRATVGGLGPVW